MNFCLHGSARTVKEAVARAQHAETLGFEAIFFADSQMNNVDPYQAMAMCALNTKTIRFGTAVTNMVYRDPTITASSYATLNEISQGRAIVGMGTGDGPVYSLGRTATKLAEFEKGLRVIRDLLHDRGVDVPRSKERKGRKKIWTCWGNPPVIARPVNLQLSTYAGALTGLPTHADMDSQAGYYETDQADRH